MRFQQKLIAAVALASGINKARACSCLWGQSLCDKFQTAAIVLRAEVLSSERLGSSINDDIVYEVRTTEVFKGGDEPGVEYDVSMTFDLATGGNSALCGINMDEGEEYLIDLYRDDFNGGRLYAAGSCGLVRPWSSVSPEDEALLREGCEGYDPCDGACGKYQECTFFSTGYAEVEYYCSDSCDDPTQCGDEEVCELVYDGCVDYSRPCPPAATCKPSPTTPGPAACPPGDFLCADPHMQGLRGQKIDWSGVDGGWYSLVKDDSADLIVNVRLTAPLPDEFPDRQLVTGLSVVSEGHSLVIEVENPYAIHTDGCPDGVSPCLANGGLRVDVDGQEADDLLRFSRGAVVADGVFSLSASNLPVECRQFGGDKIWARLYQEMLEGRRELLAGESFEDWILTFDRSMAAPGWCAKYIAEKGLADLQSTHAIFKIESPTATVRLNVGVNSQGDGELDWDGRVLPDLEFWQMDVGFHGLDVESPALSGILGETARPVYDDNGNEVMEGFEAFRGTVEDYRVSGALGTHFPLLDKTGEDQE